MAIAETAQLAVELRLKDQLSGGIATAEAKLAGLNRATSGIGSRLGSVERGFARAGGAAFVFGGRLRSAGGALASLIGGPFGLIASGGVLAGFGAIVRSSVDASQEFITSSMTLGKVTGQNISQASQLVDVLEKYGLEGDAAIRVFGLLEKNIGALGANTKKLTAFQKEYGLSLTTSNGHLVDANELLLRAADYFNSSAKQTDKATVLNKLFGRSWKDLIPLLSLGRKGLEHQFDVALRLTPQQIKNMVALRNAQRELNDTWGDTQVLVGTALTPAITKAVRALNSFISTHQGDIVNFFKSAADFAGQFASAVRNYVLPAISKIGDAWNSIPPEFRQILIAGFVGNKVLKMTLGVDVIDTLRKTLFNAVLGIRAGVVNVSGPIAGGGAVPVGGGARGGLLGKVVQAVSIVSIAAEALAVFQTWQNVNEQNTQTSIDVQKQAVDWLSRNPSKQDLLTGLAGVEQGINDIKSNPLNVLVQGQALNRLAEIRQAILLQLDALNNIPGAIARGAAAMAAAGLHGSFAAPYKAPTPKPVNRNQTGGGDIYTVVPRRRQRAFGGPVDAGSLYLVGENGPEFFAPTSAGKVSAGTRIGVNVNVSTSARQNEQGRTIQFRYGPVPATAGAS